MKNIAAITVFTILLFLQNGYAQSDTVSLKRGESVVIDSISIRGNDITEPIIILRELTFKIGQQVDSAVLAFNRERIFSLDIFNQVELHVVKHSATPNELLINVDESWYIYPVPFLDRKENSWKKISYGVDIQVKNFRGMREEIGGRIGLGYDPHISVYYERPYLIHDRDLYGGVSLSYFNIRNKSLAAEAKYGSTFDQRIGQFKLVLGKRFLPYQWLGVFSAYYYVESPKYVEGVNASNERIDRLVSVGALYVYDSRDLKQFPQNGYLFEFIYENKGIFGDIESYGILNSDIRAYHQTLFDIILKARVASRQVFGNSPHYDNSFLGLGDKIRGYTLQEEGNSRVITQAEMHYPLFYDYDLKTNFPIIPKQLQRARVSLFAHIYGDAGVVRYRGEPLTLNDFYSGYGVGLTLLVLPYNSARVEYGFNDQGKSEINVDIGISF